jgi:hypothetical protein
MKKDRTELEKMLNERPLPVVHGKRVVGSDNKTNITYFVKLEMHRLLKQAAVDRNTSLQELMNEALDLLFAKYGFGPFEPVPSRKRK